MNSRPVTYIDEDPDSNIITPHHLTYRQNINEKCFETNHVPNISSTDTQNLAARMKLVLEHYFKRFEKEYTLALQEQHFYVNRRYGNYKRELRGDIVLIKEDILPRMRWRKGKVINVIRGRDNLIRGVELEVYQPNLNKTVRINRPLQHIVPFEITEEKTNTDIETDNEIRPKRIAAANADLKRRLTTDIVQWHFCQRESVKKYIS